MAHRTVPLSDLEKSADPVFRVVIVHDDHVSAQRGKAFVRAISGEMGLSDACLTVLWNIELFDTPFGREAAIDVSTADILVVGLRSATGLSGDMVAWIGRWLMKKKDSLATLIVGFENSDEPSARKARTSIERAAQNAGKDFFSQPLDDSSTDTISEAHEFLWVI